MSTPAPAPSWADHVGVIIGAVYTAGLAIAGLLAAAKRWLRRRERKRELREARDELLRELADCQRWELRMPNIDPEELTRRRTLLDRARNRFWIAKGNQLSEPIDQTQDSEEDAL